MNYFWLYSLLAPACIAASNLVDNHVLYTRIRDPVSYDILTTWPSIPVAVSIFLATKISFAFDAWFVGIVVGFSFAFLFILYCFGMMREQGANVVSIIFTSPLFVAVLAFVFLSEKLSTVNYVGIFFLIMSAFLVLYKKIDFRNPGLGILLFYALGLAISRVAAKSALEGVDVWSYFFWFLIGGILGSIVLSILGRRNLATAIRRLDVHTLLLIATTAIFGTIGLVLLYSAFSLGSVTIASGLTAIQPSIVFLYSVVLLRFRPTAIPSERTMGKWADVRKLCALLLIVLGALALMGL